MSLLSTQNHGQVKAIYWKEDRRKNIYELTDPLLREQARAVAAIIPRSHIISRPDGYALSSIIVPDLKTRMERRKDARYKGVKFRKEPSPATGTVFLIHPKYVLTAGHCVPEDIKDDLIVFDFKMEDAKTPRTQFPSQDVYKIKKVVAFSAPKCDEEGHIIEKKPDWAIFKVVSEVVGRTPLSLNFSQPIPYKKTTDLPVGEMIGHSQGLPQKFSAGFLYDKGDPDYFAFGGDCFAGYSGSPISYQREVIGILANAPGEDYLPGTDKFGGRTSTPRVFTDEEMKDPDAWPKFQKLCSLPFIDLFLRNKRGDYTRNHELVRLYTTETQLFPKQITDAKIEKLLLRGAATRWTLWLRFIPWRLRGSTEAHFELGKHHFFKSEPLHRQSALYHFTQAADQGHPVACHRVWNMCKEGSKYLELIDLQKSRHYLERGAQLGNADCQYELGYLLCYGSDRLYLKTQEPWTFWMRKSFEQGILSAKAIFVMEQDPASWDNWSKSELEALIEPLGWFDNPKRFIALGVIYHKLGDQASACLYLKKACDLKVSGAEIMVRKIVQGMSLGETFKSIFSVIFTRV